MRVSIVLLLAVSACIDVNEQYRWTNPYDPNGTGGDAPSAGDVGGDPGAGDAIAGDQLPGDDAGDDAGDAMGDVDPGDTGPSCANGWCVEAAPSTQGLEGVHGFGTTVWAAGGGGAVLVRNGALETWSRDAPVTSDNFHDVFAFSDTHVVVGSQAGSAWIRTAAWAETGSAGSSVEEIWGVSGNFWFTTASAGLFFYDGAMQSQTSAVPLTGLWGLDATRLWAVGSGGRVLESEDGSTWSQPVLSEPWQTPDTAEPGIGFGAALACGDVNGDGYDDLVVGVPGSTESGFAGAGRIELFFGAPSGFSAASDWGATAPTPQADAAFGTAVAVGDMDGDLVDDILVGEPYRDNGFPNTGRVYLFIGASEADPTAVSLPQPAGLPTNARLGAALVAVSGLSGTAYADAAVGAPGWDSGAPFGEGAVFFYQGGATVALGPSYHPADQAMADFGAALAAVQQPGGAYALAVGAPLFDGASGNNSGKIWVAHVGASFTLSPGFEIDDGAQDGRLGSALATVDLGSDDTADLAAGNPGVEAARFYSGDAGGFLGEIQAPAGATGFGNVIAGGADLNEDGVEDVVFAAEEFSGGSTGEGRIYVRYLGGSLDNSFNWHTDPANQADANFGAAAIIVPNASGDGVPAVVASAPARDPGGRVYAFWSHRTFQGSDAGMDIPTGLVSIGLHDVHGSGTSDVWVVGDWCAAWHWDGGRWGRVYLPCHDTQVDLRGVWAAAPDSVWVVGLSPNVYHWNGSGWVTEDIGVVGAGLEAVWAEAADGRVWAVGSATSSGLIVRRD